MKITILTDNKRSWFIPFGNKLLQKFIAEGNDAEYIFDKNEIKEGDICFLLSCEKILDKKSLEKNKRNIVVHASDLPAGKGFSPLQWQILEGKNEITVTLMEASEEVDSGGIYFKRKLTYDGSELYDELREKLGRIIVDMCNEYAGGYKDYEPQPMTGRVSNYRKRNRADDEIDAYKTIATQFNHFRIADNEKHPLYFKYRNNTYILKIYKKKKEDG